MRFTEPHGHVERMPLPGVGTFAATERNDFLTCTVSFDFQIVLKGANLPRHGV